LTRVRELEKEVDNLKRESQAALDKVAESTQCEKDALEREEALAARLQSVIESLSGKLAASPFHELIRLGHCLKLSIFFNRGS
jgi:hypothetical protein